MCQRGNQNENQDVYYTEWNENTTYQSLWDIAKDVFKKWV